MILFAFLVYQAGIANVFAFYWVGSNPEPQPKRLLQGSFHSCEMFARGLVAAGVRVTSAACNKAGDIINEDWTDDMASAPFADKFHPVNSQ